MEVLSALSVLLYIHILQHGVNCRAIFDASDEGLFKTRCSTKCQGSETESVEENSVPLYKCSCSPSCVVYGDCCYDSNYRNATTWSKTDFMCLSVVNRGRYRVVSGCPADQLSDFCRSGIGHLSPVTSRKTGTTYANVFCASCNGDAENLVTWNVELRCSTDQASGIMAADDVSVDSEDAIIYHSGHLWNFNLNNKSKSLCMYHVHFEDFSVIDDLELRYCGSLTKISDCSASWRNSEVMKLCRSYEDPVFFGNKLYRNYHCAECNYMSPQYAQCMPFNIQIMQKMGLIDSDTINYCKRRGLESCIQYLSGMDKGRPFSFSELMNIVSEKRCVQPGKRCCPGERYDFKSKRCRKIVKNYD